MAFHRDFARRLDLEFSESSCRNHMASIFPGEQDARVSRSDIYDYSLLSSYLVCGYELKGALGEGVSWQFLPSKPITTDISEYHRVEMTLQTVKRSDNVYLIVARHQFIKDFSMVPKEVIDVTRRLESEEVGNPTVAGGRALEEQHCSYEISWTVKVPKLRSTNGVVIGPDTVTWRDCFDDESEAYPPRGEFLLEFEAQAGGMRRLLRHISLLLTSA